jgi:hypothetical protein
MMYLYGIGTVRYIVPPIDHGVNVREYGTLPEMKSVTVH